MILPVQIMFLKLFVSSLLTLFILDKFCRHHTAVKSEEDNLTFIQLFQKGVDAYRAQKWLTCINSFARAMDDYKTFKKQIGECRHDCHEADKGSNYTTEVSDVENRFFETAIKHTLCLVRCKAAHFGHRETKFAPDVEDAMEKLVPYDYLQMCYFNAGQVEKALTAAYTFLNRNPGHEAMQHNIQFYLTKLTGDTKPLLHSVEPKPHQDYFLKGMEAFDKKAWKTVVDHMEQALENYWGEEEQLRSMCEGPFDQDSLQPDLYIALANHLTYALKCRQRCAPKLQQFDGYSGGDFVGKCYFYLQEAYEKLDQLEESMQAAASFLLLHPEDETMLKRKEELLDMNGAESEWFAPRKEVVQYAKRELTEKILLANLEADFKVLIAENKARDFKQDLRSLVGLQGPGEEGKIKTLNVKADDGKEVASAKDGAANEDAAF